ncbi:hypothetical protein ABPG75_011902 [Micractinium tetrahymenae]
MLREMERDLEEGGGQAVKVYPTNGDQVDWMYNFYTDIPFTGTENFSFVNWKEGGAFSDAAGLHFTGFNGEPVPVSPTAGAWLEFGASVSNRQKLVTRAVSLRVGSNTVVVRVALSQASKAWELTAAANGKVLTGPATLAGGVKVGVARFDPPSNLVASRVTIDAGFVQLVVSQRWDPKANQANDNVNFGVTLVGPLKLPVSGALQVSYTAAFRRAPAGAAAMRAVPLALSASGGADQQP